VDEQEFVELRVRVPVQIAEFLEAINVDVQEYCEDEVVSGFGADLDAFFDRPSEHPWGTKVFGALMEKLSELKEAYGNRKMERKT